MHQSEHKARVNAIAWPSETSIFSADAAGCCGSGAHERGARQPQVTRRSPRRSSRRRPPDRAAPSRRRLLLQTRKNQLLALDTRLQHFGQRYSDTVSPSTTCAPPTRSTGASSSRDRSRAPFTGQKSGARLPDGLMRTPPRRRPCTLSLIPTPIRNPTATPSRSRAQS